MTTRLIIKQYWIGPNEGEPLTPQEVDELPSPQEQWGHSSYCDNLREIDIRKETPESTNIDEEGFNVFRDQLLPFYTQGYRTFQSLTPEGVWEEMIIAIKEITTP